MDDELIKFLRARLDEDERTAHATHSVFLDWEYDESVKEIRDLGNGNEIASVLPQYGAHIARHDPARVLREIDAVKRLIIKYEVATEMAAEAQDLELTISRQRSATAYMDAIKLLALPYADHPDYREEWRP